MSNTSYAAGVDIGGTHIDGVCIDKGMRIVRKAVIPMSSSTLNKKLIIANMFRCLDLLCQNKGKGLIGIGAAVPGVIKNGVVKRSPNLPFLDSANFRSLLSRRYRTRVVVDNDVNCMAFGELAGKKDKNLVALTLGTGIGGGIVIGGEVYRGKSFAGEIGHMTINHDGSRCRCGNLGCFEEYASVRSVRRLSRKFLGKSMEPHDVYRLAKKGNRKARLVWQEYGKMLGIALANVSLILDPDAIILGGGISKAYEFFKDSMKEEMKKRMLTPPPKIRAGKPNANAFGAACMAMMEDG